MAAPLPPSCPLARGCLPLALIALSKPSGLPRRGGTEPGGGRGVPPAPAHQPPGATHSARAGAPGSCENRCVLNHGINRVQDPPSASAPASTSPGPGGSRAGAAAQAAPGAGEQPEEGFGRGNRCPGRCLHAGACLHGCPLAGSIHPLLWEVSGNDPSLDDTSMPPTLITVAAKHFVSILWQAASRLPAAPEHPQSQPGSGRAPSAPALRLPAAEPAPDASQRGGSCRAPRGCAAGWDTGRWAHVAAGGSGHPLLAAPRGPGCTRESCVGASEAAAAAGSIPRHGHGRGGRRCGGGCRAPEHKPQLERSLLQRARLCASVCLRTCACVCLCAQPGKVTVRERCRQPRNGLGMESVSQVEPQGWPEPSRSSPSVVTVSICGTAAGGAGPVAPGHPHVPLGGEFGQGRGPRRG